MSSTSSLLTQARNSVAMLRSLASCDASKPAEIEAARLGARKRIALARADNADCLPTQAALDQLAAGLANLDDAAALDAAQEAVRRALSVRVSSLFDQPLFAGLLLPPALV